MDKNETNDKKLSKCEDFDDILEIVGSKGKYQKFLLYVVLCPIITVQPIFTLNALFMLYQPNHWCHVPGKNNETDIMTWKNYTIPTVSSTNGIQEFSKCTMYGINQSVINCNNGWEYDTKDYDLTIPSQFNWVCDQDHYATDSLTLYAVGNCIGTLIFGWAADKYGRKPICFLTIFINTFFRGVSLFVPNYFPGFLLIQLIVGIAFPMMYITPSMIVAELSAKDYRGWIYAVTWMIWVIGLMSLPIISYLLRNWFIIGAVTSAPGILLFIYYWFLPESPRWLLSIGQIKKAAKIVEKIALMNGTKDKISCVEIEEKLNKIMLQNNQKISNHKKTGVWTLFSKQRLALNTILVTISWSLNALIYYGVTLNSSYMSGNQFLNFFLLSIIELPAGYLGGILVNKTGRRWTQVVWFMVGGIAFITAAIGISSPGNGLVIAAVIVAKFCVTLTFLVVYLQGAEIFPTELRSTGSGFASTVASAIGITGPYLIFLRKYNAAVPYLVLAFLSISGVIASSFLPETLNQSLPESVEDANKFGEGIKFWSYLPPPPKKNSIVQVDNSTDK